MSLESENNKRIAKNSVFLYLRMLLVMGVSLYTSRVILQVLGVSDYGVYNVMGGIIGMLGYVNILLAGGTSRFLTISLGEGNKEDLVQTFSLSNLLCILSAGIFLLLGETIGLWFMNTQLNIDPLRMDAANWVYQCALFSSVLAVIQTPFTATIIAHEKMNVYAYMSIFDVGMKLAIVYALLIFDIDKLKMYASLMLLVNALSLFIYAFYSKHKFEETNFRFYYEKNKFKAMFSYSGWNMISAFANILNSYGLNILLNIFFGTVVNAARGLALQVNNIANQLYSNFQTASRPQIMKYYAQGNILGMENLILNTSKYSGYLLLGIIIPIFFNIDGLLQVWLGQNPEYTSSFVKIILVQTLCSAIDYPVGMGIHAVGKMKLPNLTSAFLYLSIFPITYVAMKLGATPIISYIIYVAIAPIILFVDLWILNKYTGIDRKAFFIKVLLPIIKIAIIGILFTFIVNEFVKNETILSTIIRTAVSCVATYTTVFFFGLSKRIRNSIFSQSITFVKRLNNK